MTLTKIQIKKKTNKTKPNKAKTLTIKTHKCSKNIKVTKNQGILYLRKKKYHPNSKQKKKNCIHCV